MGSVLQRYFIECPYGRAKALLRDNVREIVAAGGKLRLDVPINHKAAHLDLQKDVDVSVSAGVDPMHFDEPWKISWRPHDGGPYPVFDGTLAIRADEDWNVAAIELTGSYTPPLGFPGKMFDAVVGSRIAFATARALLKSLGDGIVERYRAEEAAKTAPQ